MFQNHTNSLLKKNELKMSTSNFNSIHFSLKCSLQTPLSIPQVVQVNQSLRIFLNSQQAYLNPYSIRSNLFHYSVFFNLVHLYQLPRLPHSLVNSQQILPVLCRGKLLKTFLEELFLKMKVSMENLLQGLVIIHQDSGSWVIIKFTQPSNQHLEHFLRLVH